VPNGRELKFPFGTGWGTKTGALESLKFTFVDFWRDDI